MATIKITELTSIGANLTSSTVIPVVNMSGTPTTEKTLLGNIANVVLAGAGGNYTAAAISVLAQSVTNAAQPNITSTGTLTNLTVSGNVAVNGNVTSNGTAYVGNLSTTGLASITTLSVGATANLGAVSNITITGGTVGQVLSTDGNGVLSWASDATTYGNSNVAAYLPTYTGNIGANVVIANLFVGSGANLTNLAGANVSGFVPNANIANTAFAVAAANVSGLGNIATLNLDGNVSNLLTGNGTYVAIPVVPTVGNIATINLDGNNQTWLAGNGVFANIAIPSVGNIATLNLDGNVSNVLRGDGTFGADANSSYGDSNVTSLLGAFGSNTIVTTGIITADGANLSNVPYANLTGAPSLGNIASINLDGNVSNLLTGNGTYVAIPTVPTVGNIATINLDGSNTNVLYGNGAFAAVPSTAPAGSNGEIQFNISGAFASTGNLTFVDGASGGTLEIGPPGAMQLDGNGTIVANSLASASDVYIYAANGIVDLRATGNIVLKSDNANHEWVFDDNGNLTLPGNTFAVNYANGTAVTFGAAALGNVTFDDVTVQGVNGLNLSAGSDFTANLAYLQVRAGDVASHIHLDTGNNQAYDLIVGDDQNYVQVSSTGNILLSSYDSNTDQYIWTLDYNGNLILAGGNSVIQSIANSSLDPTLPNVSTMVFTPDANYNSQILVLDPTAPGHIHLRAYAFSNIDEPAANIFLGGEDTAFEITSGANNEARIHSGGNTWTFGNDGRLTFPGTPRIDTDSDNFEVQAAEAISLEANTVVNIYTDSGNTTYQWQFGDDGNLTLPANTFAINYANGTQVSLGGGSNIANGNSNVSIATANGNVTINAVGNTTMTITGTGANVTGTLTSTGKIGYASGSTVTQLTSRGTGVTINALAGTIITTSAAMVATEIDTFSVINSSVDPNNDIVLAQIVSPNQGTYDCIANPAVIGGFSDGFYINIINISGFTTSDETITIRFMVIKAPNA